MRLSYTTEQGHGDKTAIGLIALQADETIEPEIQALTALDGVTLYVSRVPSGSDVTRETLVRMEAEIPGAVELLPPTAQFAAIGYACTSGATIIGEERVSEAIRSVRPNVQATNPLSAVKAALATLGARRIGFVTPYLEDVSAAMRENLEDSGFAISRLVSFSVSEEKVVARISRDSVTEAILAAADGVDCDAVFVSCTNLRTSEVMEDTAAQIGKPVISSNLAFTWHLLRLAGVNGTLPGFGPLSNASI